MVDQGYTTSFAITKSDTAVQPPMSAIYVGVSGDISLKLGKDTTAVVFKAVPVGILKVRARVVMSAGTTATDMVGLSNI